MISVVPCFLLLLARGLARSFAVDAAKLEATASESDTLMIQFAGFLGRDKLTNIQ